MKDEAIRSMDQTGKDNTEAYSKKRMEVGKRIYEAAQSGNFNEKDLDCSIGACRSALEAPNREEALEITSDYLQLFTLGDDALNNDVLDKLDGFFRKKFFS